MYSRGGAREGEWPDESARIRCKCPLVRSFPALPSARADGERFWRRAGAAQRWITRWQGASDIWKALWIWTHIPALTVLVSFRLLSNVITSHPSFEAPSNPDIPLWRYIDLSKFVAFLQDRALYFARTDKLVDPFEGSLPKKNREILREQLTRDLGSSQAEIYLRSLAVTNRSFRTIMNISCWHANEHELAVMWGSWKSKL